MGSEDTGWSWMVVLGSFGAITVVTLNVSLAGLYHLALLDKFQADITTTAWIGATFAALSSFGGPLGSMLINRFNCRVSMMTSGALLTLGFFTTAFTTNLFQCVFSLSIVAGSGTGISYTTALVVIGYNFRRKLNIASAIAVSGAGFGVIILSPAIQLAREKYGFPGLFIISAGLGAQNFVFGALYRPSKLELQQKQKALRSTKNTACGSFKIALKQYITVHSRPSVLCFSLSFICYSFGIYLLFYHLPGFCIDRGSTALEAAWVLTSGGISIMSYRILVGVACSTGDVDELTVYLSNVGLLGLATIIIPHYANTFSVQTFYSVILGAYSGGLYAILNTIVIKLVGLKNLSTVFGGLMVACGIGQLTGPVVAGKLLEAGLGYENTFIIAGISLLAASFLAMLTPVFNTNSSFVNIQTEDVIRLDGDPNVVTAAGPGEKEKMLDSFIVETDVGQKCGSTKTV